MFEEFKIKRKVKKSEKKIEKNESIAQTMASGNQQLKDITQRSRRVSHKQYEEAWFAEYLERNELNLAISEVRKTLFLQRDRLLQRMIHFNRNYKANKEKEPYANQKRDLERDMRGSKNAAYALSVVCNAIDRLDELPDEQEWCSIMKDLTKGYKAINAISSGSDLMTRMAFWFQKARMEMNQDISVTLMERYYGKPIDELLQSENLENIAVTDCVVDDSVMDYSAKNNILNAIIGGSVFKIPPESIAEAADYQSRMAEKKGGPSIIKDTREYIDPNDMDDLPTNM